MDWEEYIPKEVYCQISWSSSSENLIVEAITQTSSQSLIIVSSTLLLKVHLRFSPSHKSEIVAVCSLTITYTSQYWTARLEVPTQLSSQNLIFFPSPKSHLYPIFAAVAAHMKPFQNCEHLLSLQFKMLGSLVLYLKSSNCLHSLSLPSLYLLTQDANTQVFKSLKSGIPKPPYSFLMQR